MFEVVAEIQHWSGKKLVATLVLLAYCGWMVVFGTAVWVRWVLRHIGL